MDDSWNDGGLWEERLEREGRDALAAAIEHYRPRLKRELSARLQNPSGGRDFRARRAMNTPGRPRSAGGVATELRSPKRPGIHAPDRFGNSAE